MWHISNYFRLQQKDGGKKEYKRKFHHCITILKGRNIWKLAEKWDEKEKWLNWTLLFWRIVKSVNCYTLTRNLTLLSVILVVSITKLFNHSQNLRWHKILNTVFTRKEDEFIFYNFQIWKMTGRLGSECETYVSQRFLFDGLLFMHSICWRSHHIVT